MVNTRNRNVNNKEDNAANQPSPPTLELVLMMQAQMLQTMQQTMANMHQAPQPHPRDKLGEFRRTKLPTFSHSTEIMDADDWLKAIEKKLHVMQCNKRECLVCFTPARRAYI
jgi:hypothetical protein